MTEERRQAIMHDGDLMQLLAEIQRITRALDPARRAQAIAEAKQKLEEPDCFQKLMRVRDKYKYGR